MKISKIYYYSKFNRHIKKFDKSFKTEVRSRVDIFRNNCFDPLLKTHKLHGTMKGIFAFSVNYSYRIIFEFLDQDTVAFIHIGDHSIYE